MKYALKEWSSTIEALGKGQVIAIWRKGGISDTPSINEPDEEFNVEQKKFVLFPTYTHQSLEKLKKDYWQYINKNSYTVDKQVQIKYWAEVGGEIEINSLEKLLSASYGLVHSEEYLNSSFNLNPSHKGKIIFLRVYELSCPILIPDSPEYSGCKSWLELKIDIPKIRSTPALGFKEFNQKMKTIKTLVSDKKAVSV